MKDTRETLRKALFSVQDEADFRTLAWRIYRYQVAHNPLYARYVALFKERLRRPISTVDTFPFLPIDCFRERVATGSWQSECIFLSSGTTNGQKNQHHIDDLSFYQTVARRLFERQYGALSATHLVFLLPYYTQNSSLVHMARHLMQRAASGAFFDHWAHGNLSAFLSATNKKEGKKVLFGLPHALLSFAEGRALPLQDFVVVETGGMKNKRKTWLREEMHGFLRERFSCQQVQSEYGMTELLSQCYTTTDNAFRPPPWMRVFIRPFDDPFSLAPAGTLGRVDIVDLANVHSCAFIATEDVGKKHADGRFEIVGRCEGAPLRGCNFLL